MSEDYDFTLIQEPPTSAVGLATRPAGLGGKLLCGALGVLIVVVVANRFGRSYAEAEAAGATALILAEAEAEAKTEARQRKEVMRGATGLASSKHDWVFGN